MIYLCEIHLSWTTQLVDILGSYSRIVRLIDRYTIPKLFIFMCKLMEGISIL